VDEQLVRPGTDLNKAIAELVDTRFANGLIQKA
jgi:sulfonate transport system substrate-binding protein